MNGGKQRRNHEINPARESHNQTGQNQIEDDYEDEEEDEKIYAARDDFER